MSFCLRRGPLSSYQRINCKAARSIWTRSQKAGSISKGTGWTGYWFEENGCIFKAKDGSWDKHDKHGCKFYATAAAAPTSPKPSYWQCHCKSNWACSSWKESFNRDSELTFSKDFHHCYTSAVLKQLFRRKFCWWRDTWQCLQGWASYWKSKILFSSIELILGMPCVIHVISQAFPCQCYSIACP